VVALGLGTPANPPATVLSLLEVEICGFLAGLLVKTRILELSSTRNPSLCLMFLIVK